MKLKELKDKILGKEVLVEIRYDDFEMETIGKITDVYEVEEGAKLELDNKTKIFTTFDYILEDEDTVFFLQRLDDTQEIILALVKILVTAQALKK